MLGIALVALPYHTVYAAVLRLVTRLTDPAERPTDLTATHARRGLRRGAGR